MALHAVATSPDGVKIDTAAADSDDKVSTHAGRKAHPRDFCVCLNRAAAVAFSFGDRQSAYSRT